MNPFNDANAVAHYAEGPPRLVPGFADMQRMAGLLLAERCADDAEVLILGAGGGLELKLFAERHADWRFVGVDPAAAMLDLARETLGPLESHVTFHEGYVSTAPDGPFDGAVSLLTLHFVPVTERVETLRQVRRRLKPGSPLVVAHFSLPDGRAERALWLARYVAFARDSGVDAARVEQASKAICALPIVSPQTDEAMLAEAGFADVTLFYAGFTFRGWVAYA